MIERVETVHEERTVTIRLGVFELVAYSTAGRWHGSLYKKGESRAIVSCNAAPSADAVFGELIGELAQLAHQVGEALEAAQHECTDCGCSLTLTAPDLCESCAAQRNDCPNCHAASNAFDVDCYRCGARLRGAA